jgi:iron(III) transport system permease protein
MNHAAESRPPLRRRLSRIFPAGVGSLSVLGVILALLFAVPVISVLINIFVPSEGTWPHLAATVLPDYVLNTLVLALGVGAGVMLIGVSTAWLTTMCRFPGRRVFEWALILPLAVPAYVMAYVYTDFLQVSGPVQTFIRDLSGLRAREYWFPEIRSLSGAIVVLAFVLYPYVYLLSRAAFLEQSFGVIEVGRTLGLNSWGSFFRVALPLARPGIAAGTALVLMETLAEFGAVSYFGVQTFTTGIYRAWFSLGDRVAAAQLSAVLLAFVALVLVVEKATRGGARFHNTSTRGRPLSAYPLTGWRATGAVTLCLVPILLGFLLPAGILLNMAVVQGDAKFGAHFLDLVRNTFILAGTSALLAVGFALLLAYGARLNPGALTQSANRLAAMGYAVPGTVIAVGVLIPVARFDNLLDAWTQASLGISIGLLLTGSIAALVYAYLVRFFAVALQTVEAGLTKVTPSMDDAARSLGVGPWPTLARVHAPLMWGSLLTAALLVFVDVMTELPATLVMRPFNFDTLAVQAYNLASDERLAEASTAALTIVAVGLLPVVVLSRTIARGGREGR